MSKKREPVSWADLRPIRSTRRCVVLDQNAKRCGHRATFANSFHGNSEHFDFGLSPWVVVEG